MVGVPHGGCRMDRRSQARAVLDRLRQQIEGRLPERPPYGGDLPRVDLRELAEVAVVVRDYLAAERDYAEMSRAMGGCEMSLIPREGESD